MGELALKVLELDTLVTEKLYYAKYFIQCDYSSGTFFAEHNSRYLSSFHLTWSFLTLFIASLCHLYILVYHFLFRSNEINPQTFFYTLLLTAPPFLINALYWELYQNQDEFCSYLYAILFLRSKYPFPTQKYTSLSTPQLLCKEWDKFWDSKTQSEVDIIGLFMISLILFCVASFIVLFPMPFLTSIYPISNAVQIITNSGKLSLWIVVPMRVLLGFGNNVVCMEFTGALRSLSLSIIFTVKATATFLQKTASISERNVINAVNRFPLERLLCLVQWS